MKPGGTFERTLAAAQTGAGWAISDLYRTHQPRLVRYLRVQAGSDGDDIASETWMSASRTLGSFTGTEDDFRGWLFTIARRRLHDHRRHQARRPRHTDAPTPVEHAAPTSTEDEVLGDAAARALVASLPRDQADIVLLRVVGGFSADEVAAIVGRRPGTVRVIAHRALQRLADTHATAPTPTTDARETSRPGVTPRPGPAMKGL